jgi:hypothetical protein
VTREKEERRMRRTMIAVGLFLCMQASGAGAAQPTLAQQVVEGCKMELESYCKGVTPGEGRLLACLYAYEDKLSSRCDYALYDAATRLDHAVTALAHGATECKADIEKHCGSVKAGEGRILDCLQKHEAELTKPCQQAKKDIGVD